MQRFCIKHHYGYYPHAFGGSRGHKTDYVTADRFELREGNKAVFFVAESPVAMYAEVYTIEKLEQQNRIADSGVSGTQP